MRRFVILIPSYKPDEHLHRVVCGMREAGFSRFVLVDDGSGSEYRPFFDEFCGEKDVCVLRHPINRGKGAALKTGLAFIRDEMRDASFVITVDADGQHRPGDVLMVANAAAKENALVLGSRNFSLPQVPPRSRFGNRLTSLVFRLFCKTAVGDTQTGLRAIPCAFIDDLIQISGERYEYETNVLLNLRHLAIPLKEVEIETVYYDQNSASHFHPIRDSLRIYGLIFRFWLHSLRRLFRFSLSSVASTLLDFLLFYVLHFFFSDALGLFAESICQALSRAASSVFNFGMNRALVFRQHGGGGKRAFLRYYAVAIPQLILSALTLNALTWLFGVEESLWVTLLKGAVDLVLFFVSYHIQSKWVFGKES